MRWRGAKWLLLVVGLLAACTRSPAPPSGGAVTITFACMDHQREMYQDLAEDFQKANPDIRITFVSANEAAGLKQEGNTLSSSGSEIAGLAAAADTFVWFAQLRPDDWGYLLDLQPFVDKGDFPADDFYPGALDAFRWKGGLRGLPAEIMPILIFYDKAMFDEAGVAHPQPGWTWDDFLDAAGRLTRREGETTTRYGFVDSFPRHTAMTTIYQSGVSLWDERADPPRPLFDRPETADALRRYLDLNLTYGVMPMPEIGSNAMAFTLVNGGQAAMWTGFAFDYDYQTQRAKVGVAPFPEDVAAANPRSMSGFFASAGGSHPEAAWRWLTYLSAHHQPMGGPLPGRRSVGERMRWWRGFDKDARAVIEYALAHPAPPENPLNLPLWQAIRQTIQGEAGLEESLAAAQTEALELQARLAAAPPAAPQPVAPPPPTSAAETTITFAPRLQSDMPLYRDLAAAFRESHPQIAVEIAPPIYDPSAAGCDCFAGNFSPAYPETRQHLRSLEPLMALGEKIDLDDFYPSILAATQSDGELWGLPYEADALLVYYNRARFDEAGVSPPTAGWEFDDFLDAAASLSGDGRFGFTTREGAYSDLLFALERQGARLVDDDSRPAFDDPATIAALARYADLTRRQPFSPATPSRQSGWPDMTIWGVHPAGVDNGLAAMWVDYAGNYTVAPPLPFEVGVSAMPGDSTEFEVSAYYVSAYSAQPQACWEWLAFLSGRPEPVRLLPARRAIAESPEWRARVGEATLPAYQATLACADAPIFRLRWEGGWLGYAYPWLEQAYQAAVAGQDAGAALTEAQRKAEAYLLCLGGDAQAASVETLRACAAQVDPDYPALE